MTMRAIVSCVLLLTVACICTVEMKLTNAQFRPVNFVSLNEFYRGVTSSQSDYKYRTLWFDQQIDHFGFANNQTFPNRYLVADQFWNRNNGPIFFYTGNEGDIEWFCRNTGFMWDIAAEFGAMLVFAEHRYYGKSMPFGAQSFKDKSKLNYLTSEQALADFAELISYVKTTVPGAEESLVVAFGGSYGGMLSAWFRIKYPNIVVGAIAASAPIWQFTGLSNGHGFYDVASSTWSRVSQTCVENAYRAYRTLDELASTAEGLNFISSTFGLCSPLTSRKDVEQVKEALQGLYVNYAEVDYPYPANFLADLPGWPVKEACKKMMTPLSGRALIQGLSHVTNVYFNSTGSVKCINLTDSGTSTLGYQGWDYQSCTEMVMPIYSQGKGMFLKSEWDFDSFSDECYKTYGVRPRRDWVKHHYWGKQLEAASNIVFSNGDLDPWSSGGVSHSYSQSVIALTIKEGAHHLDLRAANKGDTQYVRDAREIEKNMIRDWLGITSEQPSFKVVS